MAITNIYEQNSERNLLASLDVCHQKAAVIYSFHIIIRQPTIKPKHLN